MPRMVAYITKLDKSSLNVESGQDAVAEEGSGLAALAWVLSSCHPLSVSPSSPVWA